MLDVGGTDVGAIIGPESWATRAVISSYPREKYMEIPKTNTFEHGNMMEYVT